MQIGYIHQLLKSKFGKVLCTALLCLTLAQTSRAAVISITDDGVNTTTIAFRGGFDSSGLLPREFFAPDDAAIARGRALYTSDFAGGLPDFWTDSAISLIRYNDTVLVVGIWEVSTVTRSAGWTDPSGDLMSEVVATDNTRFFIHLDEEEGLAAFVNIATSGDVTEVHLPGSLADNGFTPNQFITFNNVNVDGDVGQITVQTAPFSWDPASASVPEPSSTALLALSGVSFLLRRRRKLIA